MDLDMDEGKFEKKQDEILKKIQRSYAIGRLIPFIGAGFPRNIADFPDWDEFVKEDLNNSLSIKGTTNLWQIFNEDNIKATEYYVYKKGYEIARKINPNPKLSEILEKGKQELGFELRLKFDPVQYDKDKWEVYNEFFKLDHFSLIYTTNWDKTLEDACRNIFGESNCHVVISPVNLREYFDSNIRKKCVIKYHGDYHHDKTIIATESDYMQRWKNKTLLDIKFEQDLIKSDFLFIGFSFKKDIFIQLVLSQINDMLRNIPDNLTPKIFMTSIDEPHECLEEYFRLNRITMIILPKYFPDKPTKDQLITFFRALKGGG